MIVKVFGLLVVLSAAFFCSCGTKKTEDIKVDTKEIKRSADKKEVAMSERTVEEHATLSGTEESTSAATLAAADNAQPQVETGGTPEQSTRAQEENKA